MRCSTCGHDSPPGSSFCLNCGSSLAQTPAAAGGLPVICPACRGENPANMKFCRQCGTSLAAVAPIASAPMPAPAYGAPGMGGGYAAMPPAGAIRPPTPAPVPAMPLGMPPPPVGMEPPEPTLPPIGANAPQPMPVKLAAQIVSTPIVSSPVASTIPGPIAPKPTAQGSTVSCPRCGTQTPLGFAYCQNCGLHMQAVVPTDPSYARTKPQSHPPAIAAAMVPSAANASVDPQAATLAADPATRQQVASGGALPIVKLVANPAPAPAPAPATGAAWGTAVLVNRDGSDGQRFPLASEDVVIGRAGADIAFDDDRFLARQHARVSRGGKGVEVHAIDTVNGVFKKADGPVELADGAVVLVGREVLRFERVDTEERTAQPLVRHGVALFGSPPRDPWGRLAQLVPSGGYRDVRHLVGDEIVLGREEGDIVFRDDAFMSRRHAALTWDGRACRITDLGSSNGTFVRVAGSTAVKHGDHVRVGDQLLRIEIGK